MIKPGRKLTISERLMIDMMRTHFRRGQTMTAGTLGHYTGQHAQGASLVLASAVRKGLVARIDGRPVRFGLTSRGRELAKTQRDRYRAPACAGSRDYWDDVNGVPRCPVCLASAATLRVPDNEARVPQHPDQTAYSALDVVTWRQIRSVAS